MRAPNKSWPPFNKPDELRQSIGNNLRQLKQQQIQLVHFRVMTHYSIAPFKELIEARFEL